MCAVQSKLTPISASCIEYVHPWTEHCSVATAGLLLQAAQESFRIYSAVYTVSEGCPVATLLLFFFFCCKSHLNLFSISVEFIDAMPNTNCK